MEFTLLSADAGEDTNDSSLVFRLDYAGSSWLFTGDASASVLDSIVEKNRKAVDVDVLKVSHHGSAYSNPIAFIKYASPEISLIGVGKDNEHGHPATTTMSRLIKFSKSIYRTDNDGGITVTYDGTYKVTTLAGKNAGNGQAVSEGQVIGNVKSLVCHLPGCSSLPAEKNRVYFDSIADAEEAGYKPCGYCCK
jgi:competence protein ComEC